MPPSPGFSFGIPTKEAEAKEEGLGQIQFGYHPNRNPNRTTSGIEPAWLRIRPATKLGTGLFSGWVQGTASRLSINLRQLHGRSELLASRRLSRESAASLSAGVDLDFTPDPLR